MATVRAVLEIVAHDRPNAEVVVCSRLGDHKLWMDVLEQGAYDVLVEALPVRRDTANCRGCCSQKLYALPASRASAELQNESSTRRQRSVAE